LAFWFVIAQKTEQGDREAVPAQILKLALTTSQEAEQANSSAEDATEVQFRAMEDFVKSSLFSRFSSERQKQGLPTQATKSKW
jgi:hypothetical protein